MRQLHWKTRFSDDFGEENDFLRKILQAYGVEDIKSFLKPLKNEVINEPFLMENMDEMVTIFHDFISNENKNKKTIVIKVDPDVDGYTSTALMTAIIRHYLKSADIKYLFGNRKEHGLTYDNIKELPVDSVGLIIIPDASMSCKDAKLITKNYTAPVLVLDHHFVETEYLNKDTGKWMTKFEADNLSGNEVAEDVYTNYCCAINCHDGRYPNETLSGVGVVRKFAEAYCERYNSSPAYLDYYSDLVAVGLVADSMDLRNLETRWYVIDGMRQESQNNEFLNELEARVNEDSAFNRTILDVGWKLAPQINSVCRTGKEEEQEEVLKALLGLKETIMYKKRVKGSVPEEVSLQWDAARVACNVKNRQDSAVRRISTSLEEIIQKEELDKNSIIFVPWEKASYDEKGLTGLMANRLASKYKRPIVVLRSFGEDRWGGSCRGYSNGSVTDLKSVLEKAGVEVHGHANAAGVNLPKDKLNEIIEKCNEIVPLDEMTEIFEVDWEIPAEKMKNEYVKQVAENEEIWGNTVPKPTFAISNIYINASDIVPMGENATFIRFKHNGISYIKKYCRKDEYNEMTLRDRTVLGKNTKTLVLNVIGEFQLDAYQDQVYPQVKILHYDVREAEFEELENVVIASSDEDCPVKKKKPKTGEIKFDWEDDEEDKVEKKGKEKITSTDIDEDDFVW